MNRFLAVFILTVTTALCTWSPVGPQGGPVYSGTISQTDPPVIYFAPYASSTRLVKSTDEGRTWELTSGSLSGYCIDILVHPENPDIIYAPVGSYIYKSTNGGSSWTRLSTPTNNYFRNIEFNPLNYDVIYAVGYNYSGSVYHTAVARSDDAGTTWNLFICDTSSTTSYGYSLAIDPIDTVTVYAGGYRSSGATMVYRSTDRGETWEEIGLGVNGYYPYAIYISPIDPNIIFVTPYSSGIYRSTDRGATWTRTATITGIYRMASAQGNPAVMYVTTTSTVYRSQDTGKTWTTISNGLLGTPYFCLLPSPTDTATVYLGTKAGMFASNDYGNNWMHITTNFSFNKIKTIALANDEGTIYAECLDNAVFKSTDNGISWERCPEFLSCGNICALAVNPSDPLTVWALEGSG
ncbi:MAG: hypothetical protein ABIK47_00540 [candidate division WOR-3 bacterium]